MTSTMYFSLFLPTFEIIHILLTQHIVILNGKNFK